jgi:hypothetical protein
MKKYRVVPAVSGLFWSLKQGNPRPEPVLVYFREAAGDSGAQVVKSFNGGYRRYLEDGEYLLGPVQPPVVDGNFKVIEHSPTLLPG